MICNILKVFRNILRSGDSTFDFGEKPEYIIYLYIGGIVDEKSIFLGNNYNVKTNFNVAKK